MAAKYPDKLHELQLLFYAEAAKYNVLPLDNSRIPRFDVAIRPSTVHLGEAKLAGGEPRPPKAAEAESRAAE